MLALILIAMVAVIYLSVSARASTAGREIQILYSQMEDVSRSIEDMETQLAFILSNTEMEKRAEELGFFPIESSEIFYILVPGYIDRHKVILAEPPGTQLPSSPTIAPEYTQSLFDWLNERVFYPATPLVREVEP
jgi:hypothetical protein